MAQSCWQIDESVVRLNADRAMAAIDLPSHRGLEITLPNEPQLRLQVLGFTFSDRAKESAVDAYVRGADLVATYDESAERPIRAQAYWRRLDGAEFSKSNSDSVVLAVELVLSVNTSLLDTDPQATIETAVGPAVKLDFVGERSDDALIQLAGERFSYIELLHPSDRGSSEALLCDGPAAGAQIRHRLFRQRLEKGVILRARVRAAIVDRKNDAAVAEAAYRQFAASEPPLTV